MKTNFETNEKNRKEITTLKSVIIAATLVITGAAANAQGVWGTYSGNNHETAFLWADANVKSNKTVNSDTEATYVAFTAFLVEENEQELAVEEWMTDTENFGTFINIEEETENPLELEGWMLNAKTFEVEKDKEEPLKVENWMTAENVWK